MTTYVCIPEFKSRITFMITKQAVSAIKLLDVKLSISCLIFLKQAIITVLHWLEITLMLPNIGYTKIMLLTVATQFLIKTKNILLKFVNHNYETLS